MARMAARWPAPVALVPTMGALHAGHLALVDRARRAVGPRGIVAVSIFVNPTQFGPKEDLSRYPRPLRRDLALCRECGVNVVFNPVAADMYAADASVTVDETALSGGLCGRSRPGHFRGVCTVVAKLFNLVRPTVAVFGRKDYQQLAVIARLVRDLNLPVRIVGLDTVREPDGLAMSSRNVHLSAQERAQAPALRRVLRAAQAEAKVGQRAAAIRAKAVRRLGEEAPLGRVDYVELRDAENLEPIEALGTREAVLALAVFFGRTRLIDNCVIHGAPTSAGSRSA